MIARCSNIKIPFLFFVNSSSCSTRIVPKNSLMESMLQPFGIFGKECSKRLLKMSCQTVLVKNKANPSSRSILAI
eukprot:766133-Hanusia_phi.AAC.2